MALSALNWVWKHKTRLALLAVAVAGYLIRKFVPLAHNELELLDAIAVIVGGTGVFVPNFSQADK